MKSVYEDDGLADFFALLPPTADNPTPFLTTFYVVIRGWVINESLKVIEDLKTPGS